MGFWHNLWNAIKIYWISIFAMVYPLILLPVFLIYDQPYTRCLYAIFLMAGYWVFEVLPLAVTSLMPIFLFPMLGILNPQRTAMSYFKEVNMLFLGGLAIGIYIEYVNLHVRLALNVIHLVGCSPRKLLVSLMTVTTIMSMWISNVAATAMMIPIVEAILSELEAQGFGKIYEELEEDPGDRWDELKRPTKTASCYMIAIAYSANIGGIGTLLGTGTNLAAVGIIETSFPESPGVSFVKWMFLCLPIMILCIITTVFFLLFWYFGLWRPNSPEALEIKQITEGEPVAREVVGKKIKELGAITVNEIILIVVILFAISLWFFRKPEFITGWADALGISDIKDSSVAILAVFVAHVFIKKEIITKPRFVNPWFAERSLPWGVILLLGAGFAIADVTKENGLDEVIADQLSSFDSLPVIVTMMIFTLFTTLLTQITSNTSSVSIFLPILASVAKRQKVHPYYFMLPSAIAASFAFLMPFSTPSNALVIEPFNIRPVMLMGIGIITTILCLICMFAVFLLLANPIFGTDEYPGWAEKFRKVSFPI